MSLVLMMRRFSIRTRMYGAIGAVLSLLMLVGATGFWGINQVHRLGETFAVSTFKTVVTTANTRVMLAELRGFEKDMVIQYENVDKVAKIEAAWRDAMGRLNEEVSTLSAGEHGVLADMSKDLSQHLRQYAELAQPVVNNIKANAFDTAGVANKMLRGAHAEVAKAEDVIRSIEKEIARQAAQSQSDQKAASQSALTMFLVVVVGAVLVVVPSTLLNMQSICLPTEQAQAHATAVASGDLTQVVDTRGHDETAGLLQAQKDMQVSIARIVTEVYRSSDSIRNASHEIAAGNKDLSGRTETAASSLEETSASMQELLDNVKRAAESAHAAAASAQANATAAMRGGNAVSEVMATMQEINQSSTKISDIVGVIDGIAFQTNILALNAAVEAARAGEAGRGFAVVASEVRVLAQRSAAAAKEIKALIVSSVQKVEAGTSQVNRAGETISEVVTSAQRVSDLVLGITGATNEQLQGIIEVNVAITQLDHMTQQNAALVDKSSAASQSLLEQAGALSTLVSVFKVQGHSGPGTAVQRLALG